MFDAAHATLDGLIDRTVAQLEAHRAAGGDDDSFQAALIGEFYTAAAHMPPTAGAAHMAIALLPARHQPPTHHQPASTEHALRQHPPRPRRTRRTLMAPEQTPAERKGSN